MSGRQGARGRRTGPRGKPSRPGVWARVWCRLSRQHGDPEHLMFAGTRAGRKAERVWRAGDQTGTPSGPLVCGLCGGRAHAPELTKGGRMGFGPVPDHMRVTTDPVTGEYLGDDHERAAQARREAYPWDGQQVLRGGEPV